MANTSVAITPGAGIDVDAFTESTNGNYRQAICIADPAANAGVAAVDATYGLAVDVKRRPPMSTSHRIAAGSGDAVSIKAGAGFLRSVHIFNRADVPIYVKFHNTVGAPTPGTGVLMTFGVQAGTARDIELPDGGRSFSTGIGMSIVTGQADANASGVTADDCSVEVCYE